MIVFLLIAVIAAFLLNLNVSPEFSNASGVTLVIEFIATLFIAYAMIMRMVPVVKVRNRFLSFFLLGYTISLLILHFYWTPVELVSSGFDPARYYNYAAVMIKGGFVAEGLNYWGVVYFYYTLFIIFGLDPLVPLFLNVLLVLYVVLLLARFLNRIGVSYSMSSFILLIPEIIYYNIMSSREVLCMVFGVYIILNFFRIINKEVPYTKLIPTLLVLLLMVIIRPPYGVSTIIIIGLYSLFTTKSKSKAITYGVIMVAIAFVGIQAAGNIGDNDSNVGVSLSSTVEERISGSNTINDDFTYGHNSMAARLIPHNPIQFVVFGIIRTMAYVIITPADITDPIGSFNIITDKAGYVEWTTLFMMLLIPGVYKIIKHNFKNSKEIRLIALSFIVFFLLVGMFNTTLIQQRYRLVYDLFYFSLAVIYLSKRNAKKIHLYSFNRNK